MKDSSECLKRFRRIFQKMPVMFKKIQGNLNFDLFREILLVFSSSFAGKLLQNNEKQQLLRNSYEENVSYLRLISNLLSSSTVFLNYAFLSFFFLFYVGVKHIITVAKGRVSKNSKLSLKQELRKHQKKLLQKVTSMRESSCFRSINFLKWSPSRKLFQEF